MPVKLNSTGGGSVTLDVGSTASNFTLTMPSTTGTVALTSDISAPTTAQVLAATAGLTAGAVGTYGFFRKFGAGTLAVGSTIAGASLAWAGIDSDAASTAASPSGTWRCLGNAPDIFLTVFVRIS
jgi:hypothetical protein